MNDLDQFPADFETCDLFTSEHEGGWANSPHDKGGLTAYGISSVYWPKHKHAWYWLDDGGPTPAKAKRFRFIHFWREHSVGRMPLHYQVILYDCLITTSPRNAKKIFQRGLGNGLKIDGLIGTRTLHRAHQDPNRIARIAAKRAKYFVELVLEDPSQLPNLDGWLWRAQCMGVYATAVRDNQPLDPYGKKPGATKP